MVEHSRGSPYAIHHACSPYHVRNSPTFIRPAEISVWNWPKWTEGRRPVTSPLLHNFMPLHGPGDIWHIKVEINNDSFDWWAAPNDAIRGPFRITVKVPDMSSAGEPTELEQFLDQEIGL